ncbi:MAG TPA: hypothetical protein VEL74_13510, partial [Thermoanaerobaculia bacterium]|nr:hypothetical protein [Thermoanaerobaculia bacterium]
MIHEETSPLRSLETAGDAPVRPVAAAAGRPRLWWVGTVGALFLGGVLLVAVWAKMLDPLAFAEQIRQEKLDFLLSAEAVALIALALEAG